MFRIHHPGAVRSMSRLRNRCKSFASDRSRTVYKGVRSSNRWTKGIDHATHASGGDTGNGIGARHRRISRACGRRHHSPQVVPREPRGHRNRPLPAGQPDRTAPAAAHLDHSVSVLANAPRATWEWCDRVVRGVEQEGDGPAFRRKEMMHDSVRVGALVASLGRRLTPGRAR